MQTIALLCDNASGECQRILQLLRRLLLISGSFNIVILYIFVPDKLRIS
jgi:hypothetical protein